MTTHSHPKSVQHEVMGIHFGVIQRRLMIVGTSKAILWGLVGGVGLLIAAAWIDLALDLPGVIRCSLSGASVALAIILFGRTWYFAYRSATMREMAAALDIAAGAAGQIVTGVELAASPRKYDSMLTDGLARLATARAITLMGRVEASSVAPSTSLRHPIVFLNLLLFFILGVGLFAPRLLACQWMRMTDPFGDHPPNSPLEFRVEPGSARVIYGSDFDVRATLTGGVADNVELVTLPKDHPLDVVPMFPEGTNVWRATITNVVTPGRYFLRAGSARSQQFDLSLITVPQIGKATFRIALPAYTHRPAYDGPLPQSGIAGLPGTKVIVRVESNRTLSGGKLVLTRSDSAGHAHVWTARLTPVADGINAVSGQFEIRRDAKFHLSITDSEGQTSTESLDGQVVLLKDEKPFVRLMEPPAMSFATPDAVVRINSQAEDDYGISRLQIYRGLNESRFRAIDIKVPDIQPTRLEGVNILHLADYNLVPDDTIKVFARVEDNDPAGAKGAESAVAAVHIVSQEDMDRMQLRRDAMATLQSKYAQAARRIEALRHQAEQLHDQLAKQDAKQSLTEEQRKKMNDLAAAIEQAANDMDKLAGHTLPIDLDKALNGELSKTANDLRDAAQLAKAAGQQGIGVSGALDKLNQLSQKLGQRQQDLRNNVAAPLEYLAQIYPLIQDQARFLDLYAAQKDLAQRMAALQGNANRDDPSAKSRMRDLQDEQNSLRAGLKQLLDDIDDHANALPDDPKLDQLRDSARAFAKDVRASAAASQMRDAESALDDFSGPQAAASAQAAAETLSKFIGRCNSNGQMGQACLKFQPKLSDGLGDSINQLLSAGAMGLGSGMGGYSQSASSLQNVGLYGTIPVTAPHSGNGGEADRGVASQANGLPDGQNNPDSATAEGTLHANGAGDVPVPPQYKQRVGDYFRRVEDELSN